MKLHNKLWIALALLHNEYPTREDFSHKEVLDRAREEFGFLESSAQVQLSLHMVANRLPNPVRHRMVIRTGKGRVRLFRFGVDQFHPERAGGRVAPGYDEVPMRYFTLLDWYWNTYVPLGPRNSNSRPLLRLIGKGSSGRSGGGG